MNDTLQQLLVPFHENISCSFLDLSSKTIQALTIAAYLYILSMHIVAHNRFCVATSKLADKLDLHQHHLASFQCKPKIVYFLKCSNATINATLEKLVSKKIGFSPGKLVDCNLFLFIQANANNHDFWCFF